MNDETYQLQHRLGYTFERTELLLRALTHPSLPAEQKEPEPDNQRLEFLGDAVLQLLLSDLVYHNCGAFPEGRLTKVRSALANEQALASLARKLRLGEGLRLGNGEERSGGRERNSNLADACEAVMGAVYLDGGLESAVRVFGPHFRQHLADAEILLRSENPKGALQELTQSRYQTTPLYEVVKVTGPEHEPEYQVKVCVAEEELGLAVGASRKAAEKHAARLALKKLRDRFDHDAV